MPLYCVCVCRNCDTIWVLSKGRLVAEVPGTMICAQDDITQLIAHCEEHAGAAMRLLLVCHPKLPPHRGTFFFVPVFFLSHHVILVYADVHDGSTIASIQLWHFH